MDDLVRTGPATVGGLIALAVVALGLLVAARAANRTAWLLAAAAVAVAAWLPLRTSSWLIPVDVVVAAGLVTVAATYTRGGRLRDLTFGGGATRLLAAPGRVLQGPPVLGRMLSAGWRRRPGIYAGRGHEVARGLVLAVPIVAALALLLASADAVFASFFNIPVSAPTGMGHLVLIAVGVLLTLPLLLEAAGPERVEPTPAARIGTVESTVLLVGVVLLYTAFAVAQLVVALDGADHILDTSGLSYAEYARTGFFQLLAVAALTLVLLLAVRSSVRPPGESIRRVPLAFAEATVVLTLVIVGVALRRLALYDEVFGLTMLRLSSTVAAWWIGAVFVLVGLALAGVGRRHDWLAGAVATTVVLTVIGFNAANPEAVVVRHNVARSTAEVPFDAGYAATLSDDAVPALEAALADLDPAVAEQTISAICADRADANTDPDLSWNLAVTRAAEVRARLC
jgi:hypothetical protein